MKNAYENQHNTADVIILESCRRREGVGAKCWRIMAERKEIPNKTRNEFKPKESTFWRICHAAAIQQ